MSKWSEWRELKLKHGFTPETLKETLDGGQSFRWNFNEEECYWLGVWSNFTVRLRYKSAKRLLFSGPIKQRGTEEALSEYLRASFDWDAAIDSLPWRSDPHLADSIEAYRGLRILKQPFAETVLCFLCSATKQIPQIKVMCERMAQGFGSEIADGIHALPTWEQLASADETQLRALGLGFRAKNIKRSAELLAQQPGFLEEIESTPYPFSKMKLVSLPGVGEKVADCALLFGAGQLEAFPVDTWIIKVLERRYQLLGASPTLLAQFGRAHYGKLAGFAQQFIFSYERAYPNS